jgi:hypothetical protein
MMAKFNRKHTREDVRAPLAPAPDLSWLTSRGVQYGGLSLPILSPVCQRRGDHGLALYGDNTVAKKKATKKKGAKKSAKKKGARKKK